MQDHPFGVDLDGRFERLTMDASDFAGGASLPYESFCVLALYRSAVQPRMTEWADEYAEVADRPPTLVVIALDDHHTGGEVLARRTADKWGAEVAVLDGLGHWWMMQDAARGAEMLRTYLTT